MFEIFAPKGRNFNTAHSLLETSFAEATNHIGEATTKCDGTCGCDYEADLKEADQ